MKNLFTFLTVAFSITLFVACGGDSSKSSKGQSAPNQEQAIPASQRVELDNKGVGPISELTLPPEIDKDLAAKGEKVYNQYCVACHKINEKFIGPSPKGIFDRRSPEWVMNMILNPEVMVKEDPLAKDLLKEFGSPMLNQHLTEEQARAIVEYLRTI